MLFGLKNMGETYQMLMNRMFIQQIRQNVKVYVDDMLVKRARENNHLDDLQESSTPVNVHSEYRRESS